MDQHLKQIYSFLVSVAFLASSYTFFKPGISSPAYPALFSEKIMTDLSVDSTTSRDLAENNSDRMFSKLHQYSLVDGSQLFAVMVRVRKRDDFKIETYGLLTKGIDKIYIESPSFNNIVPYSMVGLIDGKKTLQTCVIPGTMDLDQVNVQLFPLLDQIDKLSGTSKSLISTFLGTDNNHDYSCLVLTFQPKSFDVSRDAWTSIIRKAQIALSTRSQL
jgi:hypothetical protein